MNRTVARAGLMVAALAAVAIGLAACVVRVGSEGYRAVEEWTFPTDGTPEVTLMTFDGPIEVRAWDRPEVHVEVVKMAATKEIVDAIEMRAEQAGRTVVIEARRPAELGTLFGVDADASARVIASVPSETDLVVRSGDGDVSAERLRGRIELRTEDGSIRGLDLAGELIVYTVDGSVQLEAVDGSLELSTGDGRVSVEGRLTGLHLETGDGSVRLRAEPGSTMADDWDVWTGDGGIVVRLPEGFDADIDAQTADGVVRPGRGIDVTSGESDRQRLRGRLGAGGHVLRLRTAEGSIRIYAPPSPPPARPAPPPPPPAPPAPPPPPLPTR